MIPEPQEAIDNWKKTDINQMAHHFHTIKNGQSMREYQFGFSPGVEREILDAGELDFRILMTFSTSSPEISQLSFRPEIQLLRGGKHVSMLSPLLDLRSGRPDAKISTMESRSKGAAIVPRDYKETVVRNWLSLENSQIDDVFMAHKTNLSDYTDTGLMRLMRYDITSTTNAALHTFFNEQLQNKSLNRLTLHLGVDYNKRPLFGEYNFAPVLEFYLANGGGNSDFDISKFPGLSFGQADNDEEVPVYFQYMQPCPATCPPPPEGD